MDEPIRYMQRTRDWYLALGYDNPYRWAHFAEVPFQPLAKTLADCTVALVTTAAPYDPDKGPQGRGAPYNAAAKFFRIYSGDSRRDHDVRNTHVAIDFKHTTGEDSGSWFPLPRMRELAKQGRFKLAPRFHGMPTNRSQRHTMEIDCPALLARCREDGVDAAVLVPNCPVCHQAMSPAARTTVQSPLRWSDSPEWKLDYSNPERASPEELVRARQEMDEVKAVAKRIRESAG